MRIGIDISYLPSFIVGAGRYICEFISALSKVDNTNEYFMFIKQRDCHYFQNLGSNFQFVIIPNYSLPVRIAWQITAPKKFISKYKLDVWHAPYYILPKNVENVYTVVTFHDMTFFLYPKFYSPLKTLFFRKMIKDAVERADKIVAVSRTTKNDIHAIFGSMPRKLTHVYSGTDGEFKPVKDFRIIRKVKLKYDTGDKFILFVGTLEKRKNLPLLIKAFHELVNKGYPEIKLVLVGKKGNAIGEITRNIESLGLAQHVRLPGYIPEADLPALYTAASLFAYPSHYEGFGFTTLEAMACGTPVLTSNISATKEISGLDQIQVDPTDVSAWSQKMHEILSDPGLQERLIKHGLSHFQKFKWENTAKNMLEIYKAAGTDMSQVTTRFISPESELQHGRAIKLNPSFEMLRHFTQLSSLARSVLQTLIYSDLFDYPLKVSEIHKGLVACRASLSEVQKILLDSSLNKIIENSDRYYYFRGKKHSIEIRRIRKQFSLKILFKNRRLLQFICSFPFVKATALSGAIAFKNCLPKDDIDIFLIVNSKRAWSVYFFLAAFLKLLGKRRLICINYIYAKRDLTVEDKDFFVAHQIANLQPLSGNGVYENFINSNRWVQEYLPQAQQSNGYYFSDDFVRSWPFNFNHKESPMKRTLEKIFEIRLFDKIENWVFRLYGSHIRRITGHLGSSVLVEKDQIKLFTTDHRHKILQNFHKRIKNIELQMKF